MDEGISLWWIFVLIGLATTLPRASFILAGERVRLPPAVQRALRYAPASALAAIVAQDVFLVRGDLQLLSPALPAALLVIVVALRWKSPWLPFLAGMATLWLFQFLQQFFSS